MRKLVVLFILLISWGYMNARPEEDIELKIYQIKVSRGHATLIVIKDISKTAGQQVISSTLIDAGDKSSDGRLIADVITEVAESKLDQILITHVDGDHWRGLVNDAENSKGLLWLRSFRGSQANNLFNQNPKPVKLFINSEEETLKNIEGTLLHPSNLKQVYNDKIKILRLDYKKSWLLNDPQKNGDPIYLHTIASNTRMRQAVEFNASKNILENKLRINTIDRLRDSHAINDRSAVFLLNWGNFSFLVQGDLEGQPGEAGASKYFAGQSRIARTTEYYLPDPENSDDIDRLNSDWDLAQSLAPLEDPWDENYRNDYGVVRHSLKIKSIANGRKGWRSRASDTQFENWLRERTNIYTHKIAWPDQSRHELGNVIDTHNGNGRYAHACVALVPHHGGTTSNLWFDSLHGIVGSNQTNEHFHPDPDTVEAMYNTSGIRLFYFTYLRNRRNTKGLMANQLKHCLERKEELGNSSGAFPYHPKNNKGGAQFYALLSNENYYNFNVKPNTNNIKVFDIYAGKRKLRGFGECGRPHN